MAGLLARGSVQLAAFPTCRWGQKSVASGKRSPLTVAGAAVGWYRRTLRCSMRTTFPHRSLVRERPSRALVQRRALALSMATRCITLNALSGARYQPQGVGE